MPRNVLQDVLPPDRRSVRDIPLPDDRRRKSQVQTLDFEERVVHTFEEKNISDISPVRKRKSSKFILWLSILIALLILGFAFSTVFGDATVYVTPKKEVVAVDLTLKAEKAGEGTVLAYDVITFSKTASKIVSATEERIVEKKAEGKIVIYNNQKESQTLIKNTRFESPQGLIYRISEAVTIPGKSGTTPGSKEVTVYADLAGAKYNIGLVDFTIPGFKGDPKFTTVYARSKTAMTGGASGLTKTASVRDLEQARKDIQASLRSEILAEAKNQTPQNFVLFDNAAFIEFVEGETKPASTDSIELSLRGDFHGIIFNKENLGNYIAKEEIKNFDNEPIGIPNIQNLEFSSLDGENPWQKETVSFKLKGEADIIWKYDELELKEAVAGRNLDEIQTILMQNRALSKTEIVIKPFWKKDLPHEPDKITVVQKDL